MIKFAAPWLFFLIPLPWVIRYLLPPAKQKIAAALKVPFFNEAKRLVQYTDISTTSRKKYLFYFCWFLLVLSAAGPQWLGAPIAQPRHGRNIMLALDLSGSMQIPDMVLKKKRVNRLQMVKAVASDFVKKRQGDRLSLILFGSKAYLQTPLTFDLKTVQNMLNDASIGLAGQKTAIGDAIGLAIKRLSDVEEENRILILLTDGASNTGALEPIHAANLAKQQHIKIYTIGIGANQLIVPGLLGPQVINPSTDLDEANLKNIAKITGGLFFRAKSTNDLRKVYRAIDKLEPINTDTVILRPIKEYFYWPLALALLISVYLMLKQIHIFPKKWQTPS